MEISDQFIYQTKDGQLWRVHRKAKSPPTEDSDDGDDNPYYILYECNTSGNYDPITDYAEKFSLAEMHRELTLVGAV